MLDQVRGEKLLPGDVVITDAGYGVSQPFREGLEQRQLFYIAGVTAEMVVFTEEPRWDWPEGQPTGGRPQRRPHLADDNPRPVSLKSLAECLPRHGEVVGEVRLGPRLAGPGLGRSLCGR